MRSSAVLFGGLAVLGALAATWWLGGPGGSGSSGVARAGDRRLTDITAGSGIDFRHENGARGRRHMPETMSGGAAWIDVEGDGRPDLYLVNGNEHPDRGGPGSTTNRLYRNLGGGRFRDITESSGAGDRGYGCGVAVGDVDGDGLPDLFVANLGPDVLYRNRGDGRFEDVTRGSGVGGGPGWSVSAAFLDYDLDGDLDLWVCRYVDYDPSRTCRTAGRRTYCSPHVFPGLPDLLYRNRGDGTFEEAGSRAGIAVAGPHQGKSLGLVVIDPDRDFRPDVYVACDQVPNLLFRNLGDGTFEETALLAEVAYSDTGDVQAGMGVDAGDVDLDGREDLVVTNFSDEPYALYLARGDGGFREVSKAMGLAGPTLKPLGFGCLLWDADLDGDLDLYVANGHVQERIGELRPGMRFAQPDQLLENDRGTRLRDVSAQWGPWFERALVSRAIAAADWDHDGDEDLAVVTNRGPAVLLRNDGPPSRWIAFLLRSTRSAPSGVGARVRVVARRDGGTVERSLVCRRTRGYAAASEPVVRCGLGPGEASVDRATVRWPSGAAVTLDAPALDTVHEVVEPAVGRSASAGGTGRSR